MVVARKQFQRLLSFRGFPLNFVVVSTSSALIIFVLIIMVGIFMSAASNKRGCPNGSPGKAQVRLPEGKRTEEWSVVTE